MNRAQKKDNVEFLKDAFTKAKGVYTADFRGMTVEDVTKLRFALKKADTDLKVVKNRLALRALEGKEVPEFKKHFDFMTAVALSFKDASAGAKALTQFAKENDKLKVKGGLVEGKVLNLAEIKALASLPSKPELLAKLLGTLVAVPTGFVRVLNGVPSKWVFVLEAIRRQKQEKGG